MSDSNALYVVVLAGGISHERDVSLRSGRRVADALSAAGHRVVLRDPDAGLLPFLEGERPDVVFPALHGSSGEDGSLLDLLAGLHVPAVGSLVGEERQQSGIRIPQHHSMAGGGERIGDPPAGTK